MEVPSLVALSIATACDYLHEQADHSPVASQELVDHIDCVLSRLSWNKQLSAALLGQLLSTGAVQSLDLTEGLLGITADTLAQMIAYIDVDALQGIDASFSHIVVDSVCTNLIGPFCANLRDLRLSATSITDEALIAVVKKCPLLEILHVGNTDISGEFLSSLAASCTSLATLNMRACRELQWGYVLHLLAICPQLRGVDLGECFTGWSTNSVAVTESSEQLIELVEGGDVEGLTSMDLTDVPITANAFGTLVTKCPNLRSLHANCVAWGEDWVGSNFANCDWGGALMLQDLSLHFLTCQRSGILDHCPSIHRLRLSLCESAHDGPAQRHPWAGLLELLAGIQNAAAVESLTLQGFSAQKPQEVLEAITAKLNALVSLQLSMPTSLHVHMLDSIPEITALESLDLSHSCFSFRSLAVALPLLPQLRILVAVKSRAEVVLQESMLQEEGGSEEDSSEEGGSKEGADSGTTYESLKLQSASLHSIDFSGAMLLVKASDSMSSEALQALLTTTVRTPDSERTARRTRRRQRNIRLQIRCWNLRCLNVDAMRAQAECTEGLSAAGVNQEWQQANAASLPVEYYRISVDFECSPQIHSLRSTSCKFYELAALPSTLKLLHLSGQQDYFARRQPIHQIPTGLRSTANSFKLLQVLAITASNCSCSDIGHLAAECVQLQELRLSHCVHLAGVLAQASVKSAREREQQTILEGCDDGLEQTPKRAQGRHRGAGAGAGASAGAGAGAGASGETPEDGKKSCTSARGERADEDGGEEAEVRTPILSKRDQKKAAKAKAKAKAEKGAAQQQEEGEDGEEGGQAATTPKGPKKKGGKGQEKDSDDDDDDGDDDGGGRQSAKKGQKGKKGKQHENDGEDGGEGKSTKKGRKGRKGKQGKQGKQGDSDDDMPTPKSSKKKGKKGRRDGSDDDGGGHGEGHSVQSQFERLRAAGCSKVQHKLILALPQSDGKQVCLKYQRDLCRAEECSFAHTLIKPSWQAKFKPLIELACSAAERAAAKKGTPKRNRTPRAKSEPSAAAAQRLPLLFPRLISMHVEDCPKLLAVDIVAPLLCECSLLKCTLLERASLVAPEVR
jgi:hypothetical protein